MIRALNILAAVASVAVSAAPVASAHTSPFDLAVFKSAVPSKSPGYVDSQLRLRKARPSRAVVVLAGANDYGLVARRP